MDGKYVSVCSVEIDGDPVIAVDVQKPGWLPICPSVNQDWLKSVLPEVIRRYIRRKTVV